MYYLFVTYLFVYLLTTLFMDTSLHNRMEFLL